MFWVQEDARHCTLRLFSCRATSKGEEAFAGPSSPGDRTNQGGKRRVQPARQPKRDVRAAELPDEDEQGGKFQQVEGLTTVGAEEIPCEFSVEDDFEVDETAEGVDEEKVKAITIGKKKELDVMEAFGIFDVCEELPKDAKIITTRWENVKKGDKWRCRFVAREFIDGDPEMEGLYTRQHRSDW